MGETAEERARRLRRQIGGGENIWRTSQSLIRFLWSEDEVRAMQKEHDEAPNVSLVKKYNKGTFKFV